MRLIYASVLLCVFSLAVSVSVTNAQVLVLCANSGGDMAYRGGEPGSCKKNETELRLIDASTFCNTLGLSKTVFVSSLKFTPDLVGEAQTNFPVQCAGVGTGLEGADCLCQGLADVQGLGGTYKAWLSDSSESPSTRFAQSSCPYLLVNGDTVADDWADLTDGNIQNSIRIDETGADQSIGSDNDSNSLEAVITNTNPDGTSIGGENCQDWTLNNSPGNTGIIQFGMVDESGPRWSDDTVFSIKGCGMFRHFLYCVEQ